MKKISAVALLLVSLSMPAFAGPRDDEVIVFDSTGMALQDVTAASIVYDRALERGVGVRVAL